VDPEPFDPQESEPNLVLDQAELVDSVVVSVAYVWLCCGIVLILLIPLVFLFLHIRGRSKLTKEEQM
jgi:ABC-type transport system involved in cytochrome c biogenesis permease component